jgi:hypothetical protein
MRIGCRHVAGYSVLPSPGPQTVTTMCWLVYTPSLLCTLATNIPSLSPSLSLASSQCVDIHVGGVVLCCGRDSLKLRCDVSPQRGQRIGHDRYSSGRRGFTIYDDRQNGFQHHVTAMLTHSAIKTKIVAPVVVADSKCP